MGNEKQDLSLSQAAGQFLANLVHQDRGESQQEIYRFVRWFGWERPMAKLTPPEVANYAERLSLSDINYMKKFELIRTFLTYAGKEGWCKNNLATHFKTRAGKTKLSVSTKPGLPGTTPLTQEGYAALETELNNLKNKRSQVIDDIRRAAADKDFRENAPLDAAREEKGHLEGRIRELEETLRSAIIIGEEPKVTRKAGIGDSITLRDLSNNEEVCYTIVSPREADPIKGRISSSSPIGKAIIGHGQGEIIEVEAPAGKLRYRIIEVKH